MEQQGVQQLCGAQGQIEYVPCMTEDAVHVRVLLLLLLLLEGTLLDLGTFYPRIVQEGLLPLTNI